MNIAINPDILTFITTYQCTSSCTDCCFECNPQKKRRLKLRELKSYLDQSIESYPSIKLLVLTGGECFLLKNDLDEIIKYASSKGLYVRVVTNGFWAKTYTAAYKRLSSLNNAGLTEINFSTGDDHLAFVPESSIKNGVKAALDLKMTTVINIESNKMKKFNSFGFLQDDDLKPFLVPGEDGNTPLRIVNGVWIPFTNKTKKELVEVTDSKPEKIINSIKRCTNLFTSIIIDSSHNMIACCGLTCKYSKYLYLGNVSKKSIKELYENQFNDFLKIWLFTEGPHIIMDYLTSNNTRLSDDLNNKDHMCLVCATILNNDQYLSKIKSDLTNISSNILLKYFLTLKSNHHEKA